MEPRQIENTEDLFELDYNEFIFLLDKLYDKYLSEFKSNNFTSNDVKLDSIMLNNVALKDLMDAYKKEQIERLPLSASFHSLLSSYAVLHSMLVKNKIAVDDYTAGPYKLNEDTFNLELNENLLKAYSEISNLKIIESCQDIALMQFKKNNGKISVFFTDELSQLAQTEIVKICEKHFPMQTKNANKQDKKNKSQETILFIKIPNLYKDRGEYTQKLAEMPEDSLELKISLIQSLERISAKLDMLDIERNLDRLKNYSKIATKCMNAKNEFKPNINNIFNTSKKYTDNMLQVEKNNTNLDNLSPEEIKTKIEDMKVYIKEANDFLNECSVIAAMIEHCCFYEYAIPIASNSLKYAQYLSSNFTSKYKAAMKNMKEFHDKYKNIAHNMEDAQSTDSRLQRVFDIFSDARMLGLVQSHINICEHTQKKLENTLSEQLKRKEDIKKAEQAVNKLLMEEEVSKIKKGKRNKKIPIMQNIKEPKETEQTSQDVGSINADLLNNLIDSSTKNDQEEEHKDGYESQPESDKEGKIITSVNADLLNNPINPSIKEKEEYTEEYTEEYKNEQEDEGYEKEYKDEHEEYKYQALNTHNKTRINETFPYRYGVYNIGNMKNVKIIFNSTGIDEVVDTENEQYQASNFSKISGESSPFFLIDTPSENMQPLYDEMKSPNISQRNKTGFTGLKISRTGNSYFKVAYQDAKNNQSIDSNCNRVVFKTSTIKHPVSGQTLFILHSGEVSRKHHTEKINQTDKKAKKSIPENVQDDTRNYRELFPIETGVVGTEKPQANKSPQKNKKDKKASRKETLLHKPENQYTKNGQKKGG